MYPRLSFRVSYVRSARLPYVALLSLEGIKACLPQLALLSPVPPAHKLVFSANHTPTILDNLCSCMGTYHQYGVVICGSSTHEIVIICVSNQLIRLVKKSTHDSCLKVAGVVFCIRTDECSFIPYR
jgi:hypothetical protein